MSSPSPFSEPWTMAYSKNSKKKFFFNKINKESTYEMPPNSAAPFQYATFSTHISSISRFCSGVDRKSNSCICNSSLDYLMNEQCRFSVCVLSVCHSERLFWAWVDGVIVHDSQTRMDPEKLSKDDVLSFVHQNYQP